MRQLDLHAPDPRDLVTVHELAGTLNEERSVFRAELRALGLYDDDHDAVPLIVAWAMLRGRYGRAGTMLERHLAERLRRRCAP
jgi:hypothetical protein